MITRDHQLLSHTVVTVITAWTRALMGTLRWQGKLISVFPSPVCSFTFFPSHTYTQLVFLFLSCLIIRLIQTLEIFCTWFIAMHSHISIHAPSSVMHLSSLRSHTYACWEAYSKCKLDSCRQPLKEYSKGEEERKEIWNIENYRPLCNIIDSV